MKEEQGSELKRVNDTNGVETNPDPKPDPVPISFSDRLKSIFTFFTVEPYLLCYILPIAISGLAVNKFNTEKACRVDLNYTEEICTKAINGDVEDENITKTAQLEALLMVTDMQSWQSPLQSSVPALVVLFVGAWSDRTGNRKALMLIPIVGELISSLGLILATFFFMEWPLWVTALIEAVPSALSGGQTIALMGSYSYIADVTSIESRTFRIGVVAVIVTLGFPFGTSISGVLTQSLGYYGVFTIGFVLYVIGFIYTVLRIHDVNPVETEGTWIEKLTEFFNPKNVWDTLSVLFQAKRRQRVKIILVICAHIVILGPVIGGNFT